MAATVTVATHMVPKDRLTRPRALTNVTVMPAKTVEELV